MLGHGDFMLCFDMCFFQIYINPNSFCNEPAKALHFVSKVFKSHALGYFLCRPGHIVLVSLPGDSEDVQVEVAMVLTVWRGIQNPRPHSGEVHINSCVAFRAVQLELARPEACVRV